ncbi:MAG: MOSC N-terminal beta barrel domain-containing protein [Steroidobacteraceae bacterium]
MSSMATRVKVVDLFVYPVKSTRGLARSRVTVAPTGFEWDRQWMVVDLEGRFLTQRSHPQMARIVPKVTAQALVLEAPGLPALRVGLGSGTEASGERITVRIWKDSCTAVDQGGEADVWLSRAIGQPVRLVRVAPDMGRVANPAFAGSTAAPINFPDGYPVLVCNVASLDELNRRLPKAIPMERFRPGIVIEGVPAWAEDRIDTLAVGRLTLRLVKPCTRCAIPSLDHRTGERSTDPTPVLKELRYSKVLRGVMFGENATIVSGVGAEVRRGSSGWVTFEGERAAIA